MNALRNPDPALPVGDQHDDGLARLRQRLADHPGQFEPSTAFRVASGDPQVSITSAYGVSPAAVAVTLTRSGTRIARTPLPGLVGPLGVLPPQYGEAVMREERNGSRALLAFLDVFGSRIAALFFAACEKYRLARRLRWSDGNAPNAFTRALFSLTGFGTKGLREASGVDTDIILRFAGFFAQRTRNAASLQALLEEFSGVPVTVELFRARWLTVAAADRTSISANARLGVNTTAGASVRDRASSFRVVLGPVDYRDYLAFAPGQPDAVALVALARLFVGAGLTFDVQVVLKKEQIPFCRLGQPDAPPPRLGWNSWARVAPATEDSKDAVYSAESCERAVRHAA